MDLKKKLARLGSPAPGPSRVGSAVRPTATVATHEGAASADVAVDAVAGVAADRSQTRAAAGAPAPAAEPPALDARLDAIRARLRELEQRRPRNEVRPGAIPFVEARETGHGLLHVKVTRFEPGYRHGRVALAQAQAVDGRIAATLALEPRFAEVDFGRMLLLDTETTGLAGGTGTLPFLIGTAWFEHGRFEVEQLFLRRPGEEAPMLRALGERLANASCLVTYNGKSFDWPLLRNRFVMNRLPVPPAPPHLDLLHCARRVFRHRGSGGKLTHLETEVLGHRRVGDVPGSEIPERYFAFLRRGAAGPLVPVLEHNVLDLVALAALFGELARQFQTRGQEGDPRDLLGFAEVAMRAADFGAAAAFARRVAVTGPSELRVEALRIDATLLRREGDVASAADALQRALALAARPARPALHLALAKLYEHRLGDPVRALEHARQSAEAEGPAAHRRRVERLTAGRPAQVEAGPRAPAAAGVGE